MSELTPNPPPVAGLVEYVSKLIVDARRQIAAAVNFGLTALYWRIGKRIQQEVLGSERLTGATLDRLTHRCSIVETGRESYRLKDARRRRRGVITDSAETAVDAEASEE